MRPGSEHVTWKEAFFAPVDAASVVFFRVTFGLLMIWHLKPFLVAADGVRIYTGPPVLFKFYGFAWVQPGPDWAMRLLFWGLAAAALAIALGFWYRLAASIFFAGYLYVFLLDRTLVNNHNYLICLLALLLVFVPAHSSASLDAARRPSLRSPTVPAWSLWILRLQIGIPYFYGGLAKINSDWLLRAEPMRLWLATGAAGGSLLPGSVAKEPWVAYSFSWGGLVFDLLIVPLLLWRRTRVAAFVLALAFHISNSFIFTIGVFPWLMICATTLYFSPDWPKRFGLFRTPRRAAKEAPVAAKKTRPAAENRRRLTLALIGAYVFVQLLFPFRHLLYPGNVDWTEEGHFFAWRMKVRDKVGSLRFVVVDRRTRKATRFDDLDSVLTERQLQRVMHDPHLMLQFAHHLARQLHARSRSDFEVRALTSISLNGREPQALIDPQVDLTTRPFSPRPADWILPLAE